jgi:hypothetical protein
VLRALPAAFVAVIALGVTPACALQTYGYYGHYDGYYQDGQRRAYDSGYREGLKDGERDARRGRGYSLSRQDEYRDADGYRWGGGSRDPYNQAYRRGFEAGYREGYDRVARSYRTYGPGPWPEGSYRSWAAQVGYRDGFEQGRDDRHDGDRYDPISSKRYRSADHEYDRRYGPKDDYRREYRAAFQQGYQAGYRRY